MRITDNARTTYGTRISPRIWKDNNGQLICRDCIIARTGTYDYLESEVIDGGDRNKVVKVYRTDDEVFNPVAIASFENKPFVNDHPEENVTIDNYKDLSKGYMINVRRGEKDLSNCLICDVVVTDPDVIDNILSGNKRELSLGYDTVIIEKDGKYYMTEIRGNHLALVDDGRAGCATIRDSASSINKLGGDKMKSKVRLFDEDIYEVEEIKETDADEIDETLDIEEQVEHDDDTTTLAEIKAMLEEIKEMLTAKTTQDDDVVEEVNGDIAPDGDEITEEEIVETGDCGDKLLDADEITEEEEFIERKKDSRSVYSRFAKPIADSNKTNANVVDKAFQDRYDRARK